MTRHDPPESCYGLPCSMTGCIAALDGEEEAVFRAVEDMKITFREDGHITLDQYNRLIRSLFEVRKRDYYKRDSRPLLKDLHLKGLALVCVYGHFIYLDGEDYWSFLDNENDPVVSVWHLMEEK